MSAITVEMRQFATMHHPAVQHPQVEEHIGGLMLRLNVTDPHQRLELYKCPAAIAHYAAQVGSGLDTDPSEDARLAEIFRNKKKLFVPVIPGGKP